MMHRIISKTGWLLLILFTTSLMAQNLPGFRVDGRDLLDKNGNKVLLRGTNMLGLFWDRYGDEQLPEIAKTGANCCRIFWMTGHGPEPFIDPAALDSVITNCINNNMIPLVGMWDATGEWENLDKCVDYWTHEDVVAVIKEHEEYLLVNIANEAGNQVMGNTVFREKYTELIQRMRNAGIHTPLVIDADRWGRNGYGLSANGPYLLQQDPDHNLMFDWHLWDPHGYMSGPKKEIKKIIDNAVAVDICMIVGEFGPYEFEYKTEQARIEWQYLIDYADSTDTPWTAWVWWDDGEESSHALVNTHTMKYGDWVNEPWSTTIVERIAQTSVRPEWLANPTRIEQDTRVAQTVALLGNYPNPFNPVTHIDYTLGQNGHVRLQILNVLGQNVRELVNTQQNAGHYSMQWDGLDQYGNNVAGGLYFSRLIFSNGTDVQVRTGKMVLAK